MIGRSGQSTHHGDLAPADPPAARGYRLHTLEVFNWGTFDGEVHVVRPNGDTTLLVGQNGSGKSTVVDALLTLLVRPGVRNFNVAAGAKKTERDERSYLKGAYDRSGDEDGRGIEVRFLRPKGEAYSVILACFRSVDTRKTFTIAEFLYLSADQSVEKIYCFADHEGSIRRDFGGLGPAEGLNKTLKQRGWKTTRTFNEYESWILRTIHAKKKAMDVFNQTVAVKDIQRLNDFIRQHMLEPQAWDERVDRLLGHFVQLREAHQSLVQVRRQYEHLEPIAQIGATYTARAGELTHAERLMEAADTFFAQRTIDLFTPELEARRAELAGVRSRKDALADEMTLGQDECRRLQNQIEEAGGARLREIPLLVRAEEVQVGHKRREHERFHAALRRAGITRTVDDEVQLTQLRERWPALRDEQVAAIGRRERERDALQVERAAVRSSLTDNRQELEGLRQRRENLPEWCVAVRRSLCGDLGIAAKDLPFAAELIAVRPDEREWEASIERVLRGFALSLLVPQRLYHVVSRHVDQTRLADARGRGQRLVYLRVGDSVLTLAGSPPLASDSMARKLAFRDGHSLVPWVKAEIQRHFDYRCCETIEEFQQARGLALTRARHAKSGDRRHDKDDREQATDPRTFVLGWDNREKQQRIAAGIERLAAREVDLQQRIDRLDAELSAARERLSAVDQARAIVAFADIDFARHEQAIHALEEERRAIEDQSDAITLLKRRLAEAEARQIGVQLARDEAVASEAVLDKQVSEALALMANAQAELQRRDADGTLVRHRECFADLDAAFADAPLAADSLFPQKDRWRNGQQDLVKRLRDAVVPLASNLVDAMSRFMRAFPEEHDLASRVDYLESFLGLRQRIADEDLPRHEQRFKERLNERVIQEIGLFRGELERERRDIEHKIDTLNGSLRQLEYRPGTHIRLEPRAIRDSEIIEFQTRLRECIEGSFDDSAEGNEARFVRIQELLVRLQDEHNRRWRDKVTDVRRWFDFVAAVVDRQTGKTVSSYQDSSGQSGGEKAKLAFTILVAAIAYQYDLEPDQPARDRFHFVVVDEMFSKVDDQHAEYALELFRQFGLQLLIVAPLDAKARVTQPYVGCYLHVHKRENRSEIFAMTAQEFEERVDRAGLHTA